MRPLDDFVCKGQNKGFALAAVFFRAPPSETIGRFHLSAVRIAIAERVSYGDWSAILAMQNIETI